MANTIESPFKLSNIDTEIILDPVWIPSFDGVKRRLSLSDRYSRNGSTASGDRALPARNITFDWTEMSGTDAVFITVSNTYYAFFNPDKAPFYLIDTVNNRRTEVELSDLDFNPNKKTTRWRVENGTMRLVQINSEWEDLDETNVPNTGFETLTTGESISVNNEGYTDVYPIIRIIAGAAISGFTLRNETNDTGFTFESFEFLTGSEFSFNSDTGELLLDSVNAERFITDGGPIILSPGENQLTYESSDGSVDIQIEFRNAYIF